MIKEIEIKNYKSIPDVKISLGRINVLIGPNGSGKSNVLEAITLGAAAANDKLDNEFLVSRGIRVSDDPRFMRSAFDEQTTKDNVTVSFLGKNWIANYSLSKDNSNPYSSWVAGDPNLSGVAGDPSIHAKVNLHSKTGDEVIYEPSELEAIAAQLNTMCKLIEDKRKDLKARDVSALDKLNRRIDEIFYGIAPGMRDFRGFLVYSPENSALRTFQEEGQIQPLGIRGEGLFKLLKFIGESDSDGMTLIKDKLALIDWFADFDIASELAPSERRLRIRDRYLDKKLAYFDQMSANEGFLFLLFYFCLFISKDTPKFFAIDNIDASLNPKLCSQLMTELVDLAVTTDKQAILTTHNPAILDGLDLTDDEQRLFVVSRNNQGHTRIKRILAPQLLEGQSPVRLSEAFLRGYLGGLPDNF